MAAFERIITTFTRGELSPRTLGRLDFEGRFDGVERLENFLVQVQGGAQKRSATRFVAAAKDETNAVRVVPFEVSVDQNYIIEATDLAFRFYADEARVEDGGAPIETVTPYTSTDLARLKWTQSADILFLAHPDHQPRELRRTDPTTFTMVNYPFKNGPYLDVNESETTLTLSGTTGSVTVTASAVDGINDDQGFLLTDVGRLIRWQDPAANWTWLEITAFTSTTVVTADIKGEDASAGTATDQWRLGAWSDTTGWPSVCTFHQGRLWWARTADQPQTLWATSAGSIDDFTPSEPDGTVADDHAITITIDSNQVNAVAWLVSSQKGLQVGTVGEEWLIQSADTTTGLSPLNIERVPQGSWGSADLILPVRVGTSTIYVQRGATVLRESAFSFDNDAYTAQNITVLSEHLFRRGTKRLAFVQNPIQTVWALRDNGGLAGFTFDKEQKVIAWHPHTIAGSAAGAAEVLDITSIKSATHDQLWMVVRRTINGQQHQYVEFMEEPFDERLQTIENAFFSDSGLSYLGVETSTITGLDHLEGEEVSVLGNGAVQPNKPVVDGQITLSEPVTEAHVGLPYSAEIVTMPLEAEQRSGSFVTLGKMKRAHEAVILFAETVGAKVGAFGGVLDPIIFRMPKNPMGQAVPLFNGLKKQPLPGGWEEDPRVHVLSDQPLPCTVLSMAIESQINDF